MLAQDLDQLEAPDGGKADPVQRDLAARMVEGHIAPALHVRRDQLVNIGVVGLQELERLIGENHTEPERGAHRILLGHTHAHARQEPTQKDGGVETGGPPPRISTLDKRDISHPNPWTMEASEHKVFSLYAQLLTYYAKLGMTESVRPPSPNMQTVARAVHQDLQTGAQLHLPIRKINDQIYWDK